jgi:3-oxoadipate enol-lactonase
MAERTVNGCRIHYELEGPDEAELLVLSNGILMSTASWAMQMPALLPHYRVLRYDCRGQWQSEHPPGPYTMEQHADDLVALLDALDIEHAHLGGISYGAEISIVAALRHPERVRSLLLSSAVSQVDTALAAIADLWIAAAERRDADLLFASTYPFNFSERWIAANGPALAAARERYKSLDFAAFAELCRAFLALNITAQLHTIAAPTLILVGEEDTLKPRRYSDLLAREIPHATYALLPGAGHALCWEAEPAFNSLFLGFLALQKGGERATRTD